MDNCRPAVFARDWLPGREIAGTTFEPISAKARGHLHKAMREGYTVTTNQYDYRNSRLDQILAINQSKTERQGREMHDSYNHPQPFGHTEFCHHHHFILLLCLDRNGIIVGYMEFYIVGEFAQTSRILGHASHMKNGIMDLIFVEAFELCHNYNVKLFCYGEWESGLPGLKVFKTSLGFKPTRI